MRQLVPSMTRPYGLAVRAVGQVAEQPVPQAGQQGLNGHLRDGRANAGQRERRVASPSAAALAWQARPCMAMRRLAGRQRLTHRACPLLFPSGPAGEAADRPLPDGSRVRCPCGGVPEGAVQVPPTTSTTRRQHARLVVATSACCWAALFCARLQRPADLLDDLLDESSHTRSPNLGLSCGRPLVTVSLPRHPSV